MQLTPELAFAVAIAVVVFLVGVLRHRARTQRTRSVGRRVSGGPKDLRFSCAGCSQQFTHSRRTLASWEKGSRQFFCHACHTRSRGSQPARKPGSKTRNGTDTPVASGYWFPARQVGWGWGRPTAWQGWVVLAAFVGLLLVGALVLLPTEGALIFTAYTTLLAILLLLVCWMKGERPRWRRGGR